MTPTTGAADIVILGKSNHVLLSRRSLFRCVVYALTWLREAVSVRMKNNKFCTFSTLFLRPVRPRHEIYFRRRCLKDVNTGTNLFSPQSKLGCRSQDFAGKFTFVWHFKGVGIHVKKLTKIAYSFDSLSSPLLLLKRLKLMKVTVPFWLY